MPDDILRISGLTKTYAGGHRALDGVDLSIRRGEIFALLGPNGAGKTTLIGIVCGIVNATSGTVAIDGHDIRADWRAARERVGLVPQELTTDAFETVFDTVSFSRGLFGKPPDAAHVERVLRSLSLWDKRGSKIIALSGGMKRRLLIAKALSHEPMLLFLDEPTAGVDVTLRREMWQLVRELRDTGVTVILTTHYIEEAEEMADRVGVIAHGRLVLVERTAALMSQLGRKVLTLTLQQPLDALPALPGLPAAGDDPAAGELSLAADGHEIVYAYDAATVDRHGGIAALLTALAAAGVGFKDLRTRQSSLEDIFVGIVGNAARRDPSPRDADGAADGVRREPAR